MLTQDPKPARRTRSRRKPKAPAQAEVETQGAAAAPAAVEPAAPELAFAARFETAPERPRPTVRRAIFFDVENTSRAAEVIRLLEQLAIDQAGAATELIASGNWRVIGNEVARILARHGAHLVHSAPATGVRDWSDLRIAVSAGVWLASARPGDELDIVSDDKAFDVVGDVAASLGVRFRKLSYRALREPKQEAGQPARRGGGRRGRGGERAAPAEAGGEPAAAAAADEPRGASPAAAEPRPEPHSAPGDELLTVVHELLASSPHGVSLDAVANRLKALGFERPPGSPRLVTRLRRFKELDVSPRGRIKLRAPG
ncbi:MAG: hypothetical protein HYZ28_19165 [Myxococcales bacterium]|nr:hypothetical protein [Myxococcales bacterium]